MNAENIGKVDRRPPVLKQSSRSRRPVSGNGTSNGPRAWMGAAVIAGHEMGKARNSGAQLGGSFNLSNQH